MARRGNANPARLLAAAIGVVLLALLAVGGVAAYRAIMRFREPLPPEPGLARRVVPSPPRKGDTAPPKVVEERPPCPIVPEPKVYKDTGQTAELLPDAAIVLGAKATEPERYAAERLQGLIERRFKRELPIISEEGIEDSRQVILLGQRSTNRSLDRLCGEKGVELSAEAPGQDGFAIEIVEEGERQLILIGGSNDRGVVYGEDAFFDLLRGKGDSVVFPVVSVRDWPSIAWRGAIADLRAHLEPGALDGLVRARLNFIPLWDMTGVPRRFVSSSPLSAAESRELTTQAHRRGLFVYGTACCSFAVNDPSGIERTFAGLRELGADGFWISFDDLGAAEGSGDTVRRILALGERLGVRGRAVATTPPMGAYQHVASDYARAMVKVPGFDEAIWFFTSVPSREWADAAREVGLKRPAWWHNWPRTGAGLLHRHYGGQSLRAGDQPAYLDLQPLSAGWGAPKYEAVRDLPEYTDTVIYCGLWPEEATGVTFGIWAWHPERHDWERTCRAIRAYVFGPSHVGDAQRFDAALASLKPLFALPRPDVVPGYNWPPHLRRVEDRAEALRLLDEMDAALQQLEAGAPAETALEPERLRTYFLEPMRATAAAGRRLATYEFPAGPLVELEDRLLALLAEGEAAAAEQEFLRARGPLLRLIDQTEAAVAELQMTEEWLAELRERLGEFSYWTAFAERRQQELRDAFARLYPKGAEPPEAPALLNTPPPGQALAELPPREWLQRPIVARGLWTAGVAPVVAEKPAAVGSGQTADGNDPGGPKPVPEKGARPRFDVLVLTHPFLATWHPMPPGEYVEVRAEMPVPKRGGPLTLQVPLAVEARGMPEGHVVAELWANGQRVLEHDVALGRPEGEWLDIGATEVAKGRDRLKLRFRVTTRRARGRFRLVAYLGSLRLLAGGPSVDGKRPMTLPTGGEGDDGR